MAHADGWIEAYGLLEEGKTVPAGLRGKVLSNRNGIGETMLHWYAIEGASEVLEKIIELGFEVNTTNEFGQTPLFEAALIGRWDNVEVLLRHGADASIRNNDGETISEYLEGNPKYLKKLNDLISRG